MPRVSLALYTLTLALGLSALAAGAVHLPILAAYAALVIMSALLCASAAPARASEHQGPVTLPAQRAGAWRALAPEALAALIWFVLAGVCLLQALPLPLSWLQKLSPESADIWSRALRPFGGAPPELASLSLAPGRSLVEAAKAASYALVLLLAAELSRRRGLAALLWAAFACALAVAVVTAAHQLAGAELLYGFYRPVTAFEIAPLLNANNRAGYLSLGFFCGLGLLFHNRGKPVSLVIAVGLVLLLAEILMCRSRGGTLCLLGGMLAFLLWPRAKRTSSDDAGRLLQAAIVLGIGASATAMAVLAIRQDGWEGLFSASAQKLDLFGFATKLIRATPWLGIGRGAFGTVAPAYQQQGENRVYDHAENFVLQWGAEWGIPLTLLALGGLAFCFSPLFTRRATARSLRRAALVGALVLGAQNLVDLGLEVPAVGALLACVLGALVEGHAPRTQSLPIAPWLRAGSAALALCVGLALYGGNASAPSEREALHAALGAEAKPTPAFWSGLRRAIEQFPADPYFPLLGASAALAEGKNAVPWVSRALERSPASAQAHLLLARILQARQAKGQALGALRRALELDPAQSYAALQLASSWGLSDAELERVIPEGRAGVPCVQLLARQPLSASARLRWLEEWVSRTPDDRDAHYSLAMALVADAERGAELCGGQAPVCLARAEGHLAPAGSDVRVKVLHARLLVAQGRAGEAEAMLERDCAAVPADENCALALVEVGLKNDSPAVDAAIRLFVASACTTAARCAEAHRQIGDRFAGAKQWHTAFDHYQRAIQELPEPALYRAAARAATALDQPVRAAALLERARTLDASAKGTR